MSVDNENDDVLSLNLPHLVIAGSIGITSWRSKDVFINDEWVVQATNTEQEDSIFDMVAAGKLNENNEIDIVMVEAGAKENTFENRRRKSCSI